VRPSAVGAFRAAAATALTLTIAACGGSSSHTLTVAEPQGTLRAKTGDVLALSFGAQPGVGYVWQLLQNSSPSVATATDEGFMPDDSGVVGGPGSDVFRVHARDPGASVLSFRHVFRGKPLGDRSVTIVVS
jgi:predicted secreted protein